MAEREGFEPSVRFPVHTLSRRAPSTARSSLRLQEIKLLNCKYVAEGQPRKILYGQFSVLSRFFYNENATPRPQAQMIDSCTYRLNPFTLVQRNGTINIYSSLSSSGITQRVRLAFSKIFWAVLPISRPLMGPAPVFPVMTRLQFSSSASLQTSLEAAPPSAIT